MRAKRSGKSGFPTSPDIKRVLSAVQRAGLEIAAVEIEKTQIRVFTVEGVGSTEPEITPFDRWKQDRWGSP